MLLIFLRSFCCLLFSFCWAFCSTSSSASSFSRSSSVMAVLASSLARSFSNCLRICFLSFSSASYNSAIFFSSTCTMMFGASGWAACPGALP